MMDIPDTKTLLEWVQTLTREEALAFGHRLALRGIPYSIDRNVRLIEVDSELFTLATLRLMLSVGVNLQQTLPGTTQATFNALKSAEQAASKAKMQASEPLISIACICALWLENSAAVTAATNIAELGGQEVIANTIRNAVTAVPFDNKAVSALSWSAAEAVRQTKDVPEVFFRAASVDSSVVESGGSFFELMTKPLWWAQSLPDALQFPSKKLVKVAPEYSDGVQWDFWRRWYDALVQGQPMSWELQREVALIPDEVWKAGPGSVAQRIAEIEARFRPESAPAVNEGKSSDFRIVASNNPAAGVRLLAIAASADIVAQNAADQIDDMISQFLNASQLNSLPAELSSLLVMSKTFRAISSRVRGSSGDTAELRTKRELELEALVAALFDQIRTLETGFANLAATPPKSRKDKFIDDWLAEAAKTLGGWQFLSTLVASGAYMTGAIGPELMNGLIESAKHAFGNFGPEIQALPLPDLPITELL